MTPFKFNKIPNNKRLEIETTPYKSDFIDKVRRLDGDLKSFESRIKTLLANRPVDEIENTDEFTKVKEQTRMLLSVAEENLKRRLMSNSTYVSLTEELADEKISAKDARANISDFLLGYYKETGERQIELGPAYAREVTLRGRLGKAIDFQTSIFSERPTDD